jgi:antitoxin component YwqK of YwqJK toxin-antitoxin module
MTFMIRLSNIRFRRLLLAIGLLVSVNGFGQWKSYVMGKRGDTLNRVDLKGRQQGPWVMRQEPVRGERGFEEEGYFTDGARNGPWRRYSLEGDLMAVENYRWGMKDGKQVYFNLEGRPTREEMWRAIDPKSPYDTVAVRDVKDPNKILRYEVVKVTPNSYKHGKWRFYSERDGRLEDTQEWIMDKLKSPDDELSPIGVSDTGETAVRPAKKDDKPKEKVKPKEVLEFEKKHSGKKKYDVRDGATGG